jgi:hypothetical protein
MTNDSEQLTWLERQTLRANLRLIMIGEWVLLLWATLGWALLYYIGDRNNWSWGAIACIGVAGCALLFFLRSAEKKLHMDD